MFGTTDAFVAANVLKSWNLPPTVCDGVAFHQMPELAPPEHLLIAGLTQFAYAIAGMSGLGCSGDGLEMDLASTYLGQLPNLKIARPEVQEKLVQEILDVLEEKAETMTQILPRPVLDRDEKAETVHSANVSAQVTPVKAGVLGWIKSLWGNS